MTTPDQNTDATELGPYLVGERPEPWAHQFLDADGAPIDLSGYQAKLTYRVNGGESKTLDASIAAPTTDGVAITSIPLDEPGIYEGELTVGNGSNRYARSFVMRVRAPLGGPLPNI